MGKESYTVKCLFKWKRLVNCKKKYMYEERITLWRAKSFEKAIAKAEKEALQYAKAIDAKYLGFAQAYWMCDKHKSSGIEVYSLVRDSNLKSKKYIDRFFDTGYEHTKSVE